MSICMRFWISVALGTAVSLIGIGLAAGSQQPAAGSEFRAPDGAFTCPVPSGWTYRTVPLGGTPVHIFEPAGGGEDRIIVAAGPSPAGTIQELAQYSMVFVSQQLLPGVQAVKLPAFGQTGGVPSAEVCYKGVTEPPHEGLIEQTGHFLSQRPVRVCRRHVSAELARRRRSHDPDRRPVSP